MFDYTGAVAVVSGASSGLGHRLAIDLAGRGAHVVGVARRAEPMADLPQARACDVTDLDAWAALLKDVEAARGRIDVLVNCAGLERRKGIESVTWQDVEEQLSVNYRAAARAMVEVVPGMLARGRGAVLNVSSDHGRAPGPHTPAYCAAKAALSAFTESIAHEVAGRGVHVHVLYPGWVPTPLGQGAVDSGMPMPPKVVRRTEDQVSRAVFAGIGKPGVEINVAKIAVLAPVMKALAPPLYRRSMRNR